MLWPGIKMLSEALNQKNQCVFNAPCELYMLCLANTVVYNYHVKLFLLPFFNLKSRGKHGGKLTMLNDYCCDATKHMMKWW